MTRASSIVIAVVAFGVAARAVSAQVEADSLCYSANAHGSAKSFTLPSGYTAELRRAADSLDYGCTVVVRNARKAVVWRGEGFSTAVYMGTGLDIDNDGHPDAVLGEDTGGGNRCCWNVTVLRLEPKFEALPRLDFAPFFDKDEHGRTMIEQTVAFYDLGPSMADSPIIYLVHQYRNGKLADITLERCPVILGDTARRVGTIAWERDEITPAMLAAARGALEGNAEAAHTRAIVRTVALQHLVCGKPDVAEKWIRDAWPPSQVAEELAGLQRAIASHMPARVKRDTAGPVVSGLPLFRHSDALFLGGALGVAAITSLADRHFASEIRETGRQRMNWRAVTQLGTNIGDVGPLALTIALWAGGGVTHRAQLTTLGREGVEAFLLAGSTTALIKGVVGRERPSSSADDADVYVLGRGFGNNAFSSFPSGHTSVAFAVATVMSAGTAHNSPRVHRTVSVLSYAAATSVGLSRLYNNKHWASDVIGGAAIGITSGLIAVRYNHRGRTTPPSLSLDGVLDHVALVPVAGRGIALAFSAQR